MQVTQLPLSPIKRLFIAVITLVLAAGCGDTYSENDKSNFDRTIQAYLVKKHWKMNRQFSGLYVEIVEKGAGEEQIQSQSEVKLVYKGTLLNGSVFDQTEPGKPLKSPVTGLIRGFQEALIGQAAGTKLKLVVPPQLGYGDSVLDKIPANSILVFDLEVVEVR